MNIQAIIVSNSTGCIILFVLLISSYLIRQRRLLSDKMFTVLTIFTIAGCVMETVSFGIDGKHFSGAYELALSLNTLLYLDNISTAFLWCLYVDMRLYSSKKHTTELASKIYLPYVVGVAGLLCNMKWHFLFSTDQNGFYKREPLGNIYYLIMAFYLGASIVMKLKYKKEAVRLRFFPIMMFILPIIIGTTTQLIFYGVALAWCSVAIGLVGIHMSLQNELAYIDPLTKIYNRNYLNHMISQMMYNHAHMCGIMLDMDHFKYINDTYGHTEGDNALVLTAELLVNAVPARVITTRFAGDEFILLFSGDDREELDGIVDGLRIAADNFNKSGQKPYSLSYSIGTSIFDGNSNVDSFLNEMDENMYEEKKIKHRKAAAV